MPTQGINSSFDCSARVAGFKRLERKIKGRTMPRGGARPGAGRKPKLKPADTGVVAPKKFGGFTTAGIKTTAAPETWPFGTKPPEAVAPAPAAPPTVLSEDMSALTPLDLLLQVMRDPGEDMRTRIQAAQLAAPYLHAKPAAAGKKEERSAAARRTSAVSKFAPATPPKLVVNNQ